jgi:hypothetical protein
MAPDKTNEDTVDETQTDDSVSKVAAVIEKIKAGDEPKAPETEPEAEPSADEPVELDESLVARAREAHLSEEDIEGLTDDPETLEKVVGLLERQAKAEPEAEQDDKLELDEDLTDPKVIEAMQALHDRLNRMEKAEGERSKTRRKERVNELIETRLDKWGDFFDASSIKGRNRISRIHRQMEIERAGREATGLKPTSDVNLFDRAVRTEFPDKHESVEQSKGESLAKKRSGQLLAKPTSETSELKGLDKMKYDVSKVIDRIKAR